MKRKNQLFLNILFDLLAAAAAWTLFYVFRKDYIESVRYSEKVPLIFSNRFYLALLIIPLFWLGLYAATGAYRDVYRKSRLKEMGQTLLITLIGVIVIFFGLILDDTIVSYRSYYQSFIALFCFHFFLTFLFRYILTTSVVKKVHSRKIGFPTLLVGSNENALRLFSEMDAMKKSSGNKFIGFIHVDQKNGFSQQLTERLPHLGELNAMKKVIADRGVEEVIVAIESREHENIGRIVTELEDCRVIIKVIPDMYDILSGQVKMTSIFGAPLIEISREIMPAWQQTLKRLFDISVSLVFLTVFSPVYLLLALGVRLSSRGPVIFSQERIGWHGKPFFIYKFRSMCVDAEKNGPALSNETDPRITRFGKFLRKSRLDELPQFINVLTGEMSIVGPRPERQYYIDRIVKKAPHYKHLLKVRPGITSWGQVKYGYAENVDQMIERLKYDIIYIENMSFGVDLKILIYTVLIVFQGRGK